jgi:predicted nucleotidyltransferase
MTTGETAMAAPEQTDKPKGIEFYGGYEVYSESGVDLTLLHNNLRRSIEERWAGNRRSAEFGLALWQSNPISKLPNCPIKRGPIVSDVETFVKLLMARHVQFVLIGGQAMRAHGSAHVTEDTDICYQRTPDNLAALVAALAPIHPYLRGVPPGLPFRFDVPTLAVGLNFTLDTDHGELDLLGEVSGVGNYDQVLAQSVERTVFGLTVRILSVDGLIAAKKAAGRNKDHGHLLELIELKKMLDAARPEKSDGEPSSPA